METQAAEPRAAASVETVAAAPPSARVVAFCEDLALARVAALEAFERGAVRLLERFAQDVLARELALAPADVSALAGRLIAAFEETLPVELVVAPSDATELCCGIATRSDPSLSAGDIVLVVRDGTVDARLPLRLHQAVGEAVA